MLGVLALAACGEGAGEVPTATPVGRSGAEPARPTEPSPPPLAPLPDECALREDAPAGAPGAARSVRIAVMSVEPYLAVAATVARNGRFTASLTRTPNGPGPDRQISDATGCLAAARAAELFDAIDARRSVPPPRDETEHCVVELLTGNGPLPIEPGCLLGPLATVIAAEVAAVLEADPDPSCQPGAWCALVFQAGIAPDDHDSYSTRRYAITLHRNGLVRCERSNRRVDVRVSAADAGRALDWLLSPVAPPTSYMYPFGDPDEPYEDVMALHGEWYLRATDAQAADLRARWATMAAPLPDLCQAPAPGSL